VFQGLETPPRGFVVRRITSDADATPWQSPDPYVAFFQHAICFRPGSETPINRQGRRNARGWGKRSRSGRADLVRENPHRGR
jgi:hypothetical protein